MLPLEKKTCFSLLCQKEAEKKAGGKKRCYVKRQIFTRSYEDIVHTHEAQAENALHNFMQDLRHV